MFLSVPITLNRLLCVRVCWRQASKTCIGLSFFTQKGEQENICGNKRPSPIILKLQPPLCKHCLRRLTTCLFGWFWMRAGGSPSVIKAPPIPTQEPSFCSGLILRLLTFRPPSFLLPPLPPWAFFEWCSSPCTPAFICVRVYIYICVAMHMYLCYLFPCFCFRGHATRNDFACAFLSLKHLMKRNSDPRLPLLLFM